MSKVIYEVREKVGYITLNRPEKKNAIDLELASSLFDAFDDVKKNPEVWVVLLAANGKDFCTGYDLNWVEVTEVQPGRWTEDLYAHIKTIMKPTVSAIDGLCLAQGAGIALSCDVRIGSDLARFGWPQSKRGLPSISGPTMLSRMVPFNIAMQYLYTGDYISSQEALRLNLLNMIVPADQLLTEADNFIRGKILPNAPLAQRTMKEAAVRSKDMALEDAVRFAMALRAKVEKSKDIYEGYLAFFEKRPAKFTGE
jgi:enoyl-CoA hydratase/carnithine racemase